MIDRSLRMAASFLREELFQYTRLIHTDQRLVAPFIRERVLLVVDPHEVLDRGVNIAVPALDVARGGVPELVGLAVVVTGLQSCARHPHAEAIRIVVAARLGVLGLD